MHMMFIMMNIMRGHHFRCTCIASLIILYFNNLQWLSFLLGIYLLSSEPWRHWLCLLVYRMLPFD